jgi:hypothetical protein
MCERVVMVKKKIDLAILTDLHVLTTHEYEISAFDMPSVCLYACE